MQKFHRSQEEPRRNARAYRHTSGERDRLHGLAVRCFSHQGARESCCDKVAHLSYWLHYTRKWLKLYMQFRNISYSKWRNLNGAAGWSLATLETTLRNKREKGQRTTSYCGVCRRVIFWNSRIFARWLRYAMLWWTLHVLWEWTF